jgi:hypothetical protein
MREFGQYPPVGDLWSKRCLNIPGQVHLEAGYTKTVGDLLRKRIATPRLLTLMARGAPQATWAATFFSGTKSAQVYPVGGAAYRPRHCFSPPGNIPEESHSSAESLH